MWCGRFHWVIPVKFTTRGRNFVFNHLSYISFRCVQNCFSPARTSSGISFTTDCNTASCPRSLKYRWKVLRKNSSLLYSKWIPHTNFSNFLATKEGSQNLVVKQQMLVPGWSYRITVDALSPDGSYGWAAYQFDTLDAPSGGTCYVTQLNMEAAVGVWLKISCHGWVDNRVPLKYEFYHASNNGEYNMLAYGVQSVAVVYVSPLVGETVVRLKVDILNIAGGAREVKLSIKVCMVWVSKKLCSSELRPGSLYILRGVV